MVSLAMLRSSTALSSLPTSPSCSIMPSAYSLSGIPLWPRMDWRTCVNRCMRVALNQQKNGLVACVCRLMKSIAASEVSSSIVSMRFLLSGPVSSMVCLPIFPYAGSTVGSSRSVALQRSTPRAEMIFAELAGGIAERLERFRDRYVLRLKPYRSARKSDLGHPRAVNRLTGDERRTARRATVLGVVVREHHAFAGDAVDVRPPARRRCRLLLRLRHLNRISGAERGCCSERCAREEDFAAAECAI